MHPPYYSGVRWGGGGGLSLGPNFQKVCVGGRGGGLAESQFSEGVAGKEGVTFFREVAVFT